MKLVPMKVELITGNQILAIKDLDTKNTIIKMYNQGTWTIAQIQKHTNCSRNTVYKYIRQGKEEGKISC